MATMVPNKYLTSNLISGKSGEIGVCTTPGNEAILVRNNNLEFSMFRTTDYLEALIGDHDEYWRNASHITSLGDTVSEINDTAYWAANTFVKKPVVVYETDGTTGLLGINASTITQNWQLTNLDLTPYKYIKCYFKVADYETTGNYLTPALVVEVPLDAASLAKRVSGTSTAGKVPCDMYIGAGSGTNPNDANVQYQVLVAVDSTKTKFQVISQVSIYGTVKGNRNSEGRYLYKIVGCFD